MKVGLISDTHGYLDPKVLDYFEGVDHILHGGDVGPYSLILQLENLAPVTAVLGNTDTMIPLRETECVQLENKQILLHHIVDPHHRECPIQQRIRRERPDIVVYGHTHKPYAQIIEGILFLNPGYAGKQRFNLPRSIALVEFNENEIRHEFLQL